MTAIKTSMIKLYVLKMAKYFENKHYESVMKALWKHYENIMKALWKHYESIMKALWKQWQQYELAKVCYNIVSL